MEAERLIAISRRDLASSAGERDIMAAVWRAQRLAQAVGGLVALGGPRELRGEARALAETGGRGGPAPQAERLTEVSDLPAALAALGALLGDVGMALVGVACATDDEGLYWQTIEAIDAADEATEHVRAMLRRLTVPDRARPPGPAESEERAVRPPRHREPGRSQDHGRAEDPGPLQEAHGRVQDQPSARARGRAREAGLDTGADPRPTRRDDEAQRDPGGGHPAAPGATTPPASPAHPRGQPVPPPGEPAAGDQPGSDRVEGDRPHARRHRADGVTGSRLRVDPSRVAPPHTSPSVVAPPVGDPSRVDRPGAERLRERGRAVPDRPPPSESGGEAPGHGPGVSTDAADAATH
ncbi:hypothetical protein BJP40_09660 [Streptomyces sp. CC53]|uniref:DUF6099 family protein n=1 Tax=unclassified Streptomyces TaxID=2593676 RepID=UPI0008DCEC58|nr:hypothetical protein BJP40_09660 [Streptomyces sp. CC53]